MIHSQSITYRYPKKGDGFSFPDISLKNGEHLLVLGASGIGKTTLLHLIAGLLTPNTGSVFIEKTCLQTLKSKELDRFIGQNIGLVFQQNRAVTSLNVMENIKTRLFFSNVDYNHDEVSALLGQLNLEDCKDKKINELSVGQLQRLGIALAVVHRPKVILADEPTSSLDDKNCHSVLNLLLQQAEINNANLIVITHDHRIKPFFQKSIML
ncbi:ABC transporter ATP-binding protein [Galbibacter pacificus]|uniref:ATP-binding cassette domain-containing protein n=1 Tax=Galbibacter pacificus TaxID=2996052 RepID=A0ABT6FS87_9FLAO|nr:ATP-binding cassette domain-containing protein [Galbibacter pacificus]MDG3582741.1 ATP-binding cassette domain-containing protein [Galbibacter pacificus]MDG3586140.1 ATP-binding cassette domain-containing protein [Galbibacter pacificus]